MTDDYHESPMSIKLDRFEVTQTIQLIETNKDKWKLVRDLLGNAKLYHLDLGQFGYYFDVLESGEIVYLVKYCTLQFKTLDRPSVRQCLVWRNRSKNHFSTVSLPKAIFWDRLFEKYGCCISDSQQTENGEGFWDLAVIKAFKLGYIVKVHNTNDWSSQVVENPEHYSRIKQSVYGTRSFYQRYIISIEK